MGKRVIVSVISDLVTDQRVHKVCMYLHQQGAEVMLIGRRFANSQAVARRVYRTFRIKCFFNRGVLQYLEFNLKLFFTLWRFKSNVFVANDLDVLLPNFIHSTLRGRSLVFDSHEYYTGVPELKHRPFKRAIWKRLERLLLPRIRHAYTVNDSIQKLYEQEYGIRMKVIRNVPYFNDSSDCNDKLLLPADRKILLMQGAGVNQGRGFEEAIFAMQHLPASYLLVIIGGGTRWDALKHLVGEYNLSSQVLFIEKVPFEVLRCYTRQAHLGLSLDKPIAINQQLSLPNKIFDYIHAGVPVLATRIPEVEKVLSNYNVGVCTDSIDPIMLAQSVESVFADETRYNEWKGNTSKAATVLCWQEEEKKLNSIYFQLLH